MTRARAPKQDAEQPEEVTNDIRFGGTYARMEDEVLVVGTVVSGVLQDAGEQVTLLVQGKFPEKLTTLEGWTYIGGGATAVEILAKLA